MKHCRFGCMKKVDEEEDHTRQINAAVRVEMASVEALMRERMLAIFREHGSLVGIKVDAAVTVVGSELSPN